MSRILCLILMLFGLGGCGNTPATATTPTLSTLPALSNGAPCGEITISGTPPHATDAIRARQAAACFAQAYQDCKSNTLSIQDTTNNLFRQFTVETVNSGCALRQALQTDPSSPPAVADCEDVRFDNQTLIIASCSHLGDFTLTP